MSKRALVSLIASLGCACRAAPTPGPAPSPAPTAPYAGLAAAVAPPEAPNTTSVLVLHRGQVVLELYVGGATAETLHDTRSVSKTMTALAVEDRPRSRRRPGARRRGVAGLRRAGARQPQPGQGGDHDRGSPDDVVGAGLR